MHQTGKSISFWPCFFIMSIISYKDSSHLAVGNPDSKRVCHSLHGLVLDGSLCPGFGSPQQFPHSRGKGTFSFPGSRVEHDHGLANLRRSSTAISLSCAASKPLLSQPNLVLILGTSRQSPLLLSPTSFRSAEGVVLMHEWVWFFFTTSNFDHNSWIHCSHHNSHLCQSSAFPPSTSENKVVSTLKTSLYTCRKVRCSFNDKWYHSYYSGVTVSSSP